MRLLFVLLLIANALFFVLVQGYAGRYLPDGREPERLSQQIAPERIRVLTPDAAAKAAPSAAAAPAVKLIACVEVGGFTGDEVKRVEGQLDGLGIANRVAVRKTEEQASFMVYLPPFPNRAAADSAAAELRRIGVNDFYIIQDNSPLKLGISLGVFRTEDAAKAELTTLAQQGVRNAKSGPRATTVARNFYQVRNVDPDLFAKLNDLRSQYPGEELHDCTTAPTAALSSSGT